MRRLTIQPNYHAGGAESAGNGPAGCAAYTGGAPRHAAFDNIRFVDSMCKDITYNRPLVILRKTGKYYDLERINYKGISTEVDFGFDQTKVRTSQQIAERKANRPELAAGVDHRGSRSPIPAWDGPGAEQFEEHSMPIHSPRLKARRGSRRAAASSAATAD